MTPGFIAFKEMVRPATTRQAVPSLVAAIALVWAIATAHASTEDEVRAAFDRFVQVQNAHDMKALEVLLADSPQFLWITKLRSNLLILWLLSLAVSIGMWLERFVIVVTSLHRDFLPSSWGMCQPSTWDWTMFIGTIGFFFTFLFLFRRFLPMISIF